MIEEIEVEKEKRVLIIGIAGGLAQITARLIAQEKPHWKVYGVDSRKIPDLKQVKNLECFQMRYSRGNFEKLFREHEFDVVYHLGRLSHSKYSNQDFNKRLELSVMGTNRILDLSLRFGIKKLVVLSTFHVYGALKDNTIFIKEDAPLRASMKYAELRDVVEMDQICTNWMWKYQEKMSTVVLRPCNIIGSQIQNTMSQYLTNHFALRPIDYNPVFQFIHEFDMAKVLIRSVEELPTGIYNVSTNDFISLREALDIVGSKGVPFPISIADQVNKVLKLTNFDVPEYLMDYLKYSCLISNSHLKHYLGENFYRFGIDQSLKLLRM
jgi:UDP-glucose 4-epimerase